MAAASDSSPGGFSSSKEGVQSMSSRITELNESRTELLNRIQSLKQDVQNWRSKLDNQVKVYRDELSELKKSLSEEVEQLQVEFQDIRTNLKQQQDDVTASLKNLGLQDAAKDAQVSQDQKSDRENVQDDNVGTEDKDGSEESPVVKDAQA